MGNWNTSDGGKISESKVKREIIKCKKLAIENQKEGYGYNFCEECFLNTCKPIDCSHIISVAEAKKSGRAELCYDVMNIELLGRNCHNKVERMSRVDRELRYAKRKELYLQGGDD